MVAIAPGHSKQTLPLVYWLLTYSTVVGLASPLILHNLIHNVAKAFLYGSAFASSVTLTVMSQSPYLDRLREKEEREAEFRRDALIQHHVADALVKEIHTKSMQYHGIAAVLDQAEPRVRDQLEDEYGLQRLRVLPERQPAPPPEELAFHLLEVAGSEQTDEDFKEHVHSWAVCRDNNMTFVGNQGEGKTNACFFALFAWIYACQAEKKTWPTIYAFDIHCGMGRHEDYKSTWLGLPVVDKVPKSVIPCVFHGESSQLGDWLEPVRRLYNYRKKNKIGIASGAAPVIVVIDELTGHLAEMESKRAEQVSNWMTQIATGAPKFNIWIWVITHDMTESNTKVKTAFYRQSHVVMGAASAQASHIVSACQKNIAKGSIELAGCKLRDPHRNPKAPAGFVTSLPTPDGTGLLDTPLLSNKQMELPWERTGGPLAKEDPHEGFDAVMKELHGLDPDTVFQEQDNEIIEVDAEDVDDSEPEESEPEEPKPESTPKPKSEPSIKPRDINQPTQATLWLESLKGWYKEIASSGTAPSNEELAAKWVEVTGRQNELDKRATDYLRELLTK